MKKEQGFSLIELLIVVAIIAIIAAIAVPSMLQARMAANESGAVQGCRTVGSAQVAHSAINNQSYASLENLVSRGFLDSRFNTGFNGYGYADGDVTTTEAEELNVTLPTGFGVVATPNEGAARYTYGIGPDQVVRYQSGGMICGEAECEPGSALGTNGDSGAGS